MSGSMTTGWQAWGKPDKATCSWMVARLPDEIRLQLNRSEREVLEWVLFFAWKNEAGGQQGAKMANVPQVYIAEQMQRSRWTVARALDRLESFGLLKGLKRLKDKAGTWKPRLEILQGRLLSFLAYLTKQLSPWCKVAPHESIKSNKGAASPKSSPPLKTKKEETGEEPEYQSRNPKFLEILRRFQDERRHSGDPV